MKSFLTLFSIAALLFLALDLIWLSLVARSVYVAEIGSLLKPKPNLVAAVAFYVTFIAGLTFFVLQPGFMAEDIVRGALIGAAFGLVTYATYDLTNLATLNGFTVRIALIDMAWGTVLTGLVSLGTLAIAGRILR